MYAGVKNGPRIQHKNRHEGDGDDLINRVCDVMHVNSVARRLLLFYTHCPNNFMLHKGHTGEKIGIHENNISRSRMELESLGLINAKSQFVELDWAKYHVYSLLDEKHTAKTVKKKNSKKASKVNIDRSTYWDNIPLKEQLNLEPVGDLDTAFDRHYLNMTNREFYDLQKLYISITQDTGDALADSDGKTDDPDEGISLV